MTHTEADDDRVLYNMIVVRNQLDKDSEVRLCCSSLLGFTADQGLVLSSDAVAVFYYLSFIYNGCFI